MVVLLVKSRVKSLETEINTYYIPDTYKTCALQVKFLRRKRLLIECVLHLYRSRGLQIRAPNQ